MKKKIFYGVLSQCIMAIIGGDKGFSVLPPQQEKPGQGIRNASVPEGEEAGAVWKALCPDINLEKVKDYLENQFVFALEKEFKKYAGGNGQLLKATGIILKPNVSSLDCKKLAQTIHKFLNNKAENLATEQRAYPENNLNAVYLNDKKYAPFVQQVREGDWNEKTDFLKLEQFSKQYIHPITREKIFEVLEEGGLFEIIEAQLGNLEDLEREQKITILQNIVNNEVVEEYDKFFSTTNSSVLPLVHVNASYIFSGMNFNRIHGDLREKKISLIKKYFPFLQGTDDPKAYEDFIYKAEDFLKILKNQSVTQVLKGRELEVFFHTFALSPVSLNEDQKRLLTNSAIKMLLQVNILSQKDKDFLLSWLLQQETEKSLWLEKIINHLNQMRSYEKRKANDSILKTVLNHYHEWKDNDQTNPSLGNQLEDLIITKLLKYDFEDEYCDEHLNTYTVFTKDEVKAVLSIMARYLDLSPERATYVGIQRIIKSAFSYLSGSDLSLYEKTLREIEETCSHLKFSTINAMRTISSDDIRIRFNLKSTLSTPEALKESIEKMDFSKPANEIDILLEEIVLHPSFSRELIDEKTLKKFFLELYKRRLHQPSFFEERPSDPRGIRRRSVTLFPEEIFDYCIEPGKNSGIHLHSSMALLYFMYIGKEEIRAKHQEVLKKTFYHLNDFPPMDLNCIKKIVYNLQEKMGGDSIKAIKTYLKKYKDSDTEEEKINILKDLERFTVES